MNASAYEIVKVTDTVVFLVDLDGPLSVTNDAEAVCKSVNRHYPNRRLMYRDTEGDWSELHHDNGTFTRFGVDRLPEPS